MPVLAADLLAHARCTAPCAAHALRVHCPHHPCVTNAVFPVCPHLPCTTYPHQAAAVEPQEGGGAPRLGPKYGPKRTTRTEISRTGNERGPRYRVRAPSTLAEMPPPRPAPPRPAPPRPAPPWLPPHVLGRRCDCTTRLRTRLKARTRWRVRPVLHWHGCALRSRCVWGGG